MWRVTRCVCGLPPGIQLWTTVQVKVRVIPATSWTLAMTTGWEALHAVRLDADDHVVRAGDFVGGRDAVQLRHRVGYSRDLQGSTSV